MTKGGIRNATQTLGHAGDKGGSADITREGWWWINRRSTRSFYFFLLLVWGGFAEQPAKTCQEGLGGG